MARAGPAQRGKGPQRAAGVGLLACLALAIAPCGAAGALAPASDGTAALSRQGSALAVEAAARLVQGRAAAHACRGFPLHAARALESGLDEELRKDQAPEATCRDTFFGVEDLHADSALLELGRAEAPRGSHPVGVAVRAGLRLGERAVARGSARAAAFVELQAPGSRGRGFSGSRLRRALHRVAQRAAGFRVARLEGQDHRGGPRLVSMLEEAAAVGATRRRGVFKKLLAKLGGWASKGADMVLKSDGLLTDAACVDAIMNGLSGASLDFGGAPVISDYTKEVGADEFVAQFGSLISFVHTLVTGEPRKEGKVPVGHVSARLKAAQAKHPYDEQEARFAVYWSSIAYQNVGNPDKAHFVPELCATSVFGFALRGVRVLRTFVSTDRFDNDNYGLVALASMPPTFAKPVLVVAFSGTRSPAQLIDEGQHGWLMVPHNSFRSSKVSQYFMDAWQRLEQDMTQTVVDAMCAEGEKPAHVLFTGHSLGGALATMASFSIVETLAQRQLMARDKALVYTFGAPRVGNEAFVKEYSRRVPVTYRVTSAQDPIPLSPPCDMYVDTRVNAHTCRSGGMDATSAWHTSIGVYYPPRTMPDFTPPPYNVTRPSAAKGHPMVCDQTPEGEDPRCVEGLLPTEWAAADSTDRCAAMLQYVDGVTQNHVVYFGFSVSCACSFYLPPPFGQRGWPAQYNPCRASFLSATKRTSRSRKSKPVLGRVEMYRRRAAAMQNLTARATDLADARQQLATGAGGDPLTVAQLRLSDPVRGSVTDAAGELAEGAGAEVDVPDSRAQRQREVQQALADVDPTEDDRGADTGADAPAAGAMQPGGRGDGREHQPGGGAPAAAGRGAVQDPPPGEPTQGETVGSLESAYLGAEGRPGAGDAMPGSAPLSIPGSGAPLQQRR